jgi:hypothetical protein
MLPFRHPIDSSCRSQSGDVTHRVLEIAGSYHRVSGTTHHPPGVDSTTTRPTITEERMPLFRKLTALAGAAEAARRYAKKNPDKAGKLVDQAARFVDKQTKGKYKGQIDGAVRKAKGAAGIPSGPGAAGNGHAQSYGSQSHGSQPQGTTQPTPGGPYPGSRQ